MHTYVLTRGSASTYRNRVVISILLQQAGWIRQTEAHVGCGGGCNQSDLKLTVLMLRVNGDCYDKEQKVTDAPPFQPKLGSKSL